jgi:hypothetical protein
MVLRGEIAEAELHAGRLPVKRNGQFGPATAVGELLARQPSTEKQSNPAVPLSSVASWATNDDRGGVPSSQIAPPATPGHHGRIDLRGHGHATTSGVQLSGAGRFEQPATTTRRRVVMPKFMDVHHGMHGITPEALKAAHQADVDIQDEEDVDFQRAWGDPESGMVWCVSEAPNADAVKRIHERTGHPATEVYPVPVEV